MIQELSQPVQESGGRSGASSGLNRDTKQWYRPLGGVIVALLVWEVLSASGMIQKNALSSPRATFSSIISNISSLVVATLGTIEAWGIGLAVAIVLGITLGTLVGRFRLADAATETLVRMMRPLPSLALIPVAILVAGLGLKMTAGLVSFAAFWPIFINTRAGVHQVDNRFLDSAKALGLRNFELIRQVVLPAAAPMIAGGIQVAISLALVVTVSVELVSGAGGLGQFVLVAQQANATSTMFAGVIFGGALGWALSTGFGYLVNKQLPWKNQGD